PLGEQLEEVEPEVPVTEDRAAHTGTVSACTTLTSPLTVLARKSVQRPSSSPYLPVNRPRTPRIDESSSWSFPLTVLIVYETGTPAASRAVTFPLTVLTLTSSGI